MECHYTGDLTFSGGYHCLKNIGIKNDKNNTEAL
ncbi:MAG: hypothetical protein CM15mV137_040 [uncultured marine virus]|nr:MAG: hypothetical protein CM15mV137_040 [uncultured marine virus]